MAEEVGYRRAERHNTTRREGQEREREIDKRKREEDRKGRRRRRRREKRDSIHWPRRERRTRETSGDGEGHEGRQQGR